MVLCRTGAVRVGTGTGVIKKLASQVQQPQPSFGMGVSALSGVCGQQGNKLSH